MIIFITGYNCELSDYLSLKYKVRDLDKPDKYVVTQIMTTINSVRDWTDTINRTELVEDMIKILNIQPTKSDKQKIRDIFFQKNFAYIKALNMEYQKKKGKSMHSLIDRMFNQSKYVLQNILDYSISPVQYFSTILGKCMNGVFTNTNLLTSVVLLRSEQDLIEIKDAFKLVTGASFRNALKAHTSGFYKYALYELVGEHRSNRNRLVFHH